MQKDRAACIYVPFAQPVQKHLLSLIHQLLEQVYQGGQGGNQNRTNQEKQLEKPQKKPKQGVN